jgi:hypothetical protein
MGFIASITLRDTRGIDIVATNKDAKQWILGGKSENFLRNMYNINKFSGPDKARAERFEKLKRLFSRLCIPTICIFSCGFWVKLIIIIWSHIDPREHEILAPLLVLIVSGIGIKILLDFEKALTLRRGVALVAACWIVGSIILYNESEYGSAAHERKFHESLIFDPVSEGTPISLRADVENLDVARNGYRRSVGDALRARARMRQVWSQYQLGEDKGKIVTVSNKYKLIESFTYNVIIYGFLIIIAVVPVLALIVGLVLRLFAKEDQLEQLLSEKMYY